MNEMNLIRRDKINFFISMMDGLIKASVGVIGVALVGAITSSLRTISEEEKQYLPFFSRGFRSVFLWFFLTTTALIYCLMFFTVNLNEESPFLTKALIFLLKNNVSPWITLFLIIIFIVTIISQRVKFLVKSFLEKDREKRKYSVVTSLFLVSSLFTFFVTGYCVFFIQVVFVDINREFSLGVNDTREVLLQLEKVNQIIYHIILLIICIIYSLLLLLMRIFYRAIYFEKVSINIHLKNGVVLEGKFIINHNLDNSILIADSFRRTDRNKKLIPKANIEYIEFNRVDFSFGEKRTKSKLAYKEEEFDNLVKEWRSNLNEKHSNF
ncbi:hypothetical protein [Paenibacillus taichungensis]|uniref:hypothetical protein n=1 Tax=Paenibacillus taichungensis TaxID=484184 RepID=UPI0038D091CA